MRDWKYEDFNFPPKGQAHAFWEAQKVLALQDPSLSKYFRYLIYKVNFCDQNFGPKDNQTKSLKTRFFIRFYPVFRRLLFFLIRNLSKLSREKKLSFDILINPSFSTIDRKTEQDILANLVNSSLKLGLAVGVVSDEKTSHIIESLIEKSDHISPIRFDFLFKKTEAKFILAISKYVANYDLLLLSKILEGRKIYLKRNVDLSKAVLSEISWCYLTSKIRFDVAVLRCEWDDHSFSIKEFSKKLNKRICCFQHGVISHSLDIPVDVDRFFTFGQQSAQLLESLNKQFFELTNQTRKNIDFYPVGSITDHITQADENFEHKTVLIIDQSVGRAVEFNGLDSQIDAINCLVDNLLELDSVKKVIIRPHPQANYSESWRRCLDQYPAKFEISNPNLPLTKDIKKSSVAVGLFSGALVTCAASGLPVYLLICDNGYSTPDLSCFEDYFSIPKSNIYEEIKTLVSDTNFYRIRQEQCIEASSKYYKDNNKCEFDASFLSTCVLPLRNNRVDNPSHLSKLLTWVKLGKTYIWS